MPNIAIKRLNWIIENSCFMITKTVNTFRSYRALIIALIVIAEIVYSFFLHYHFRLDGDTVGIVYPVRGYDVVLRDPLGYSAIVKGEKYAGTNRWFAHASMYFLFNDFYNFIGKFRENRVENLYIVQSIGFVFAQLMIWFSIVLYVSSNFLRKGIVYVLITSLLVIPFFHVNAFFLRLTIIDISIAYTFAYALPFSLLLIYFYPFYINLIKEKEGNIFSKVFYYLIWILLGFCVAFSSPLNPILGVFFSISILAYKLVKVRQKLKISLFNSIKKLQISYWLYVFTFGIICLYSYYLGTLNVENFTVQKSLVDRYLIFFKNFYSFFITSPYSILVLYIIFCRYLLKKVNIEVIHRNQMNLLLLVIIVCVIYVLLLPMGGYRPYRPIILRYDTIMPLNLFLIITSIYYLLLIIYYKPISLKFIVILCFLFFISFGFFEDCTIIKHRDDEYINLTKIASCKKDTILKFTQSTTILNWQYVTEPEQSVNTSLMIKKWKINSNTVLFYQ